MELIFPCIVENEQVLFEDSQLPPILTDLSIKQGAFWGRTHTYHTYQLLRLFLDYCSEKSY